MAYTTFQKTFWSDDYILNLRRDEKLVYAYLVTNDKSQQCGIYELSMAKVCLELDMRTEELLLTLKKFSDDKKICYSMETQEVCIINWIKHNKNNSWRTMESVKKQLENVKNPNLMLLLYDPREPLFDGVRKVKGETGKYEEKPYTIENPWKAFFSELSDSDLLEIRRPFNKIQGLIKPLGSPLEAPCMGHLPLHNSNRTYTEQDNTETKTETVVQSAFEPYVPPTKTTEVKEKFSALMDYWNGKGNLPLSSAARINRAGEIMDILNDPIYSEEYILQCIDNYSDNLHNAGDCPYGSFQGFILGAFAKWHDYQSAEKPDSYNTDMNFDF